MAQSSRSTLRPAPPAAGDASVERDALALGGEEADRGREVAQRPPDLREHLAPIEPERRGALLVSNHSGALPPDAPMIAKAIKEEHPNPRPLHLTVEHFFKGYPGFSMLVSKLGGVPAHPANVQRLLHDEEQLVLVFPEGRKGTEKLYKDRYRLRRFGRGGFVEAAMR